MILLGDTCLIFHSESKVLFTLQQVLNSKIVKKTTVSCACNINFVAIFCHGSTAFGGDECRSIGIQFLLYCRSHAGGWVVRWEWPMVMTGGVLAHGNESFVVVDGLGLWWSLERDMIHD